MGEEEVGPADRLGALLYGQTLHSISRKNGLRWGS